MRSPHRTPRSAVSLDNQRGQALVEASLLLPVILLSIGALLVACYILFARVWIDYAGEQALYCLAEQNYKLSCAQQFSRSVKQWVPVGQIKRLDLDRQDHAWKVNAKWELRIKLLGNYRIYGLHLDRTLTKADIVHPRGDLR